MTSLLTNSALTTSVLATEETFEFFERRVRPLLIEQCGDCHQGADAESQLDLSTVEGLRAGGSLGPVVAAGDPDHSLLMEVVRYTSEIKMPPEGRLAPDDVATLARWIKDGAKMPAADPTEGQSSGDGESAPSDDWWALQPVNRYQAPASGNGHQARNAIDRFVLAKLQQHGLTQGPEADRRTLIRRLTYDLLGVPPSPLAVDLFCRDPRPDAYDRLVDRLLADPAYGERWGRHWLDGVRYADTNGGGFDYVYPNAWRYRDYVVTALNSDLPFDEFVVEQLAGDLLPLTADEGRYLQRLTATGMLTLAPKGLGMQDKRRMVLDVVDDQIDVVGRTLMGLTLACARCHDHKFDPITTADYYGLAGIFVSTQTVTDVDQNPSYWPECPLELPHVTVTREDIESQLAANEQAQAELESNATAKLLQRVRQQLPAYVMAALRRSESDRTIAHETAELVPGIIRHLAQQIAQSNEQSPLHVLKGLQDDRQIGLTQVLAAIEQHGLRDVLCGDETPLFASGNDAATYFSEDDKQQLATLDAQRRALAGRQVAAPAFVMAAIDAETPSDLQVHIAGSHQRLGTVVPRRFPEVFGQPYELPSSASGRLELAQWLTRTDHPLTARVFVNRLWHWHFGQGIVATVDNFGRLGEVPSHPKLLDWLASRFMDGEWSVKRLQRELVMSATYRQAYREDEAADRVDSGNRLMWRANRRRLEVEALRDAMLTVSGDIDRSIGGSINSWEPKTFSVNKANEETANYQTRRRTLYLPIVRGAALNEMLQLFDFGDPNSVMPQRTVTTVAPQALFLLNNPFVIEQAASFANRLKRAGDGNDSDAVRYAYRLALAREPSSQELNRALRFVGESEQSWQVFCQAVFCMNEFFYVE